MPTRCVPISLPVVESLDGLVANMDEDGAGSTEAEDASQSQLSPIIFVNESQPLTPQRQQTRPVAEIRKLARYISDATDTDEFEASWQGRDLNDLAGHVQDSRGETVRCSLHDVKVKVASFFVDGSLQKTVVTVPLPSNVLITEHHAANDPQTGADKWIDLSLIGIAPASPSTATSQLLAPATASPSTAMSQLDYSQLDQSSSSVALGKLNRPCRLERIIRNKMIAEINKEYKSVKSKTKDESRKKRLSNCGKFFWNHIKLQAMRS